jgi:hypothetical protein
MVSNPLLASTHAPPLGRFREQTYLRGAVVDGSLAFDAGLLEIVDTGIAITRGPHINGLPELRLGSCHTPLTI